MEDHVDSCRSRWRSNNVFNPSFSLCLWYVVAGGLASEWVKKGSSMYNHEELFSGVWPGSNVILCVSTGYFVYDQVDMLRRNLYNPSSPSLLVHHAVLLVCFTMALYRQVTINYLILTLFCEVSGSSQDKNEWSRWILTLFCDVSWSFKIKMNNNHLFLLCFVRWVKAWKDKTELRIGDFYLVLGGEWKLEK